MFWHVLWLQIRVTLLLLTSRVHFNSHETIILSCLWAFVSIFPVKCFFVSMSYCKYAICCQGSDSKFVLPPKVKNKPNANSSFQDHRYTAAVLFFSDEVSRSHLTFPGRGSPAPCFHSVCIWPRARSGLTQGEAGLPGALWRGSFCSPATVLVGWHGGRERQRKKQDRQL